MTQKVISPNNKSDKIIKTTRKIVRVNEYGYLERISQGVYRNWWLIKYVSKNKSILRINNVLLPKEYAGKKIRVKIEIMENQSFHNKKK